MDYELAKQLKDVGFPQGGKVRPTKCAGWGGGDSDVINPTLEELIDACGDGFWSLTKHSNIWQTNFRDGMAGETAGKTPTEAVARLWLELNK